MVLHKEDMTSVNFSCQYHQNISNQFHRDSKHSHSHSKQNNSSFHFQAYVQKLPNSGQRREIQVVVDNNEEVYEVETPKVLLLQNR